MAWNGSDQSLPTPRGRGTSSAAPRRQSNNPTTQQSNNSKPPTTLLSPPTVYFLLAILVALAAAAVWYFLIYRAPATSRTTNHEPRTTSHLIAEQKPDLRTNAAPEKVEIEKPAPKKKPRVPPPEVKADVRGILRWPNGARWIKDYSFATNGIDIYAHQKKLFVHPAEMHIAALLKMKPGDMIISGVQYGEGFRKSLMESLKTEVEFKEDDTEEERLLKEDVIAAKKQLQDMINRGEDPVALMQESRDELVRQFRYKLDLQTQLNAMRQEQEGFTLQDRIDSIEAANKMLEAQGIEKIPLDALKRRQKRLLELGRTE